ncbi:MAG: ABC transporter ATP-binding protein/permease [Candidatus Cloacimonetes bacterium]|nr:ABC transporter ATP-binding protein/permease [Candidatus Cloacimonadota bacterium]
MKTFAKITPLLKENIPKILFGIFLLFIIDGIQLIIPKIMQIAIDKIGTENFTSIFLLKAGLIIVVLTAVMTYLRYFWRIFIIGVAWFIDREIRGDFFKHLMKLSANFFNRIKTGDLMAYATNDLNAVRMLIAFGFVIGVDILLLSIGNIFFMLDISPRLTLLAILPMPILSVIIIVLGKKIHFGFHKVQSSFSKLSGKVQESFSGIRVVKAFVQEESDLEKMSESAYEYVKESISLIKIQGIFHPSFILIIGISMLIVVVYGGEAAMFQEISLGEFVAFFQYLGMFIWPMIAIGWLVNLYQRGTASLKRLNKIFEVEPEITDKDVDSSISELDGEFQIKNLTFRYKDDLPLVFDDITLSHEKGKTLAIVGRTGSGKSTLIDLVTRVYNPPQNSIYIDNHELFEIPLKVLHSNIILVPQEIFLFSDSIAENIKIGKPNVTKLEIERVTKLTRIHREILEFENGFETMIGERGVTLSGGQKQRIAIARALLIDPKILILDDALSAVDTKTEKGILQNLIESRKNRTTVIIAHRISSLQHANQIVVLDHGKIIEKGNHAELLKKNGIYHDLFEKQQIEERLEEA